MSKARIPELDGLRGIAILLVLASHMGAGVEPANRLLFPWWGGGGGGLVGVQLFFVLSGYLITGILVREREKTGTISFKAFYGRRIRRLVPALVVICATVAIAEPLVTHHRAAAVTDVLLALTYTTNLTGVLHLHGHHPQSTWLRHTWSLAVEEQFYLLWPALLAFVARHGRKAIAGTALAVSLATIAARFVVPMSDGNMYRLMRWDALLLGCALAAWPSELPRMPRLIAGWFGWAVIAVYAVRTTTTITAIDLTVTSVACAAALAGSLEMRWLRSRVLGWFGTISYGLYLWHVLILRFGMHAVLGAAIAIAISAASYYGVERRFLRLAPLDRPHP